MSSDCWRATYDARKTDDGYEHGDGHLLENDDAPPGADPWWPVHGRDPDGVWEDGIQWR